MAYNRWQINNGALALLLPSASGFGRVALPRTNADVHMLNDLLNSLPLAVGISLSPIAIIAVVVLLAQGNRKGARWFLVGWLAGLTLLTGIVAAFGHQMRPDQQASMRPWVPTAQMIVGGGLLLWVIYTFMRSRNVPPKSEVPMVLQAADSFGPLQSFGMAIFMAIINVKNVALLLAFLLILLSRPRPIVWTVASLATFIVVASLTIAVPVLYALIKGQDAEPALKKLHGWMLRYQTTILHGFIGIVGLVLLLQGLAA